MGGRNSKGKDLLEGSEWLRSVVAHYQKKRNGVSAFESFCIEPAHQVSLASELINGHGRNGSKKRRKKIVEEKEGDHEDKENGHRPTVTFQVS